jgi:hypothetical protein
MRTLTVKLDDLLGVDEELKETSTMNQLASSTKVFFDQGRQQRSVRVQIPDVELIPSVADKILLAKATTRGQNETYESYIQISDVRYVEEGTAYAISFVAPDDATYWIIPARNANEDVKVSCNCLDFYWRFATWNYENGSLLGKPPPTYVKKTERAPVNPDRVPGVCKHLLALANRLKTEKILK